jgi:hypothetical protein
MNVEGEVRGTTMIQSAYSAIMYIPLFPQNLALFLLNTGRGRRFVFLSRSSLAILLNRSSNGRCRLLCSPYVNHRFRERYHLCLQAREPVILHYIISAKFSISSNILSTPVNLPTRGLQAEKGITSLNCKSTSLCSVIGFAAVKLVSTSDGRKYFDFYINFM